MVCPCRYIAWVSSNPSSLPSSLRPRVKWPLNSLGQFLGDSFPGGLVVTRKKQAPLVLAALSGPLRSLWVSKSIPSMCGLSTCWAAWGGGGLSEDQGRNPASCSEPGVPCTAPSPSKAPQLSLLPGAPNPPPHSPSPVPHAVISKPFAVTQLTFFLYSYPAFF